MSRLNEFRQVAGAPLEYARGLKEDGKPVIGYFCTYTPEELIMAAGANPVRLFGTQEDISLADAHLQSYCCSLVKGGLENALAGRLDFLDGAVFPHTCDSIQRLSDIWRLNTNFKFFADVIMPVKLNTESAREYMRDVLKKFRRDLESGLGVAITDDDVLDAVRKLNIIRECLGEIYALRARDPGLIRGADAYALVKAAMIMDRDKLTAVLPEVVSAIKAGEFAWDTGSAKRLLLVGGVCDHPDIYGLVEDSGGVVVGDDLCMGSRYFELKAEEDGDVMAALADRYLDRPICPAKHASTTYRGERVVRMAQDASADGVVFLLLKFCDPHSFDYPYMRDALNESGVPSMLYEIEDRLPSEAQLKTRFETFIQML